MSKSHLRCGESLAIDVAQRSREKPWKTVEGNLEIRPLRRDSCKDPTNEPIKSDGERMGDPMPSRLMLRLLRRCPGIGDPIVIGDDLVGVLYSDGEGGPLDDEEDEEDSEE